MLSVCCSMLIAGAVVAGLPSSVDAVSERQIPDQYDQPHSLAELRGQVVVAMVVTAKRLRNIKPWERELRERFDGIAFLRVADVPDDSRATYASVAARLAERVPEGVSVLIDMDRVWATELDLDTGRPNLLIVDRNGQLVTTFRGLCAPELLIPVVDRLEELLEGP